jgi:hypothetical protein
VALRVSLLVRSTLPSRVIAQRKVMNQTWAEGSNVAYGCGDCRHKMQV